MTTDTALALLADLQVIIEQDAYQPGQEQFRHIEYCRYCHWARSVPHGKDCPIKRITALLDSGGWKLQDDIPNLDAMSVFHKDVGKPLVTRSNEGKWYVHQPLPPLPKGE